MRGLRECIDLVHLAPLHPQVPLAPRYPHYAPWHVDCEALGQLGQNRTSPPRDDVGATALSDRLYGGVHRNSVECSPPPKTLCHLSGEYRGTSLIRKRPPPLDPPRTLGTGTGKGPRWMGSHM